ncbi:MAG: 1-acyl-sn-glycerol-3-phosphate acyltransferase, partial [Bdellovibrionales bacterium]|nr:1-acyl-sn-glycerol-3-phosphate acyltransferase [Bdellovibrionales bacterium]
RKIDNILIKSWARTTCRMFNVKVTVTGEENIPRKTGCLYLFNHTSYFDIWAMTAGLPSFRFGAKIELFKIPFFGKAIERVGVLPINRERKEAVFKVYEKARFRILAGERFALSPEGGRQVKPVLAPFKSGPFIFAIQSQAPIVPVIIRNANRVMSKKSIIPNFKKWQQEITIEVLPSIETSHLTLDDKKTIMNQVFEVMNESLSNKPIL